MPIHLNNKLSAKPAGDVSLPKVVSHSPHEAQHANAGSSFQFSVVSNHADTSAPICTDSFPAGQSSVSPVLGEKLLHDERQATLLSIAVTLRRRGTPEDALVGVLCLINNAICEPILPQTQVVKIAKSAGKSAATMLDTQFTAADLAKEEIAEIKWIIHKLIPAGLALLAAKPKVGKSF